MRNCKVLGPIEFVDAEGCRVDLASAAQRRLRIAMGATSWWEPFLSAGLTCMAIAGLVQLGGRVYSRAILHSGPTLRLRDALQPH